MIALQKLSTSMPNQTLDTLYSGQLTCSEHDLEHPTSHHQQEKRPASLKFYAIKPPPNLEEIQQNNDTEHESSGPGRGESKPYDSDHELDGKGELRRRIGRAVRSRRAHDSDNDMDSDGYLRPIHDSHHGQNKLY